MLIVFCIFLIGISASYASDSSTNTAINLDNGNVELTQDTVTSDTSNINTNENNGSSNNVKAAAGEPKTLTQKQILAASKTVNKYVTKNKKLPNSVTIGGFKFSMNEYAYLLSKTIYAKYNKKTNKITIKYDIKNPSNANGVNIKGKLTKKQYYSYSVKLYKFMDKNKKAPNSLSTKLGNMQYQTVVYSLNRIVYLSSIKKGVLPSSASFNIKQSNNLNKNMPSDDTSYVGSLEISLDNIRDAASRVNAYVNQNDELPKYIDIGGTKYSMPKFLYLLSVAITNMNSGSTKGVVLTSVSNPSKPSGVSIKGNMAKATYVSLAKNVTTFIKNNKKAPNYANSPLGAIQFQTLVSEFSKIVELATDSKKLPDSITINVKSNDPINSGSSGISSSSQSTSLNDKYDNETLTKFLQATKNCQVTNSAIVSLAATITKGCTSDKEKATAIYNWMQKNIDYSFYYNTKNGAVKTITAKSGNCVDQSHLSIALYRAAGLAARYVHGECTFSSGSTYGHVWVQVLIGDTWTVSDTTSSRNSLGVVNNWNTNTYKLKSGKVAEISF